MAPYSSVPMKTQRPPWLSSTPQPKGFSAAGSVLLAAALIGLSLTGCGKQHTPAATPSAANQDQATTAATTPVVESALTLWQQGDTSAAVSQFHETDWSLRPLFAPQSPLSLSEDQFKALPAADRQLKSAEVMTKTTELKRLAAAVAQAGRDAAAKKNFDLARKHFASLRHCGEALDGPDSLALVRLVGQALQKMADSELAKLGQ